MSECGHKLWCKSDVSLTGVSYLFVGLGYVKMMDVEFKGSMYRIRKCVFDLLEIGDDLMDDDDSWDLVGRDLRLKSTFLYRDFRKVISSAPEDQKKCLTELANKLFCSIEELDEAVKIRSITLTHDRYTEATGILHEVMELMPSD
ncbi:hypothetical protein RHSIM_Rhsim09G0077600 [Rhododendron simsii]|uniref:Uncharacterized protein n=1 Tax=Rhododendron simsii TaxID=118357 RepID=A0A834GLI2_RHOSS|nr:hypothetical protein RHSIM_Rhsim09G0077600 [Rhododendron simsii]